MKTIIFLVLVFIPGLTFSQVIITGNAKNLSAANCSFSVSDEASGRSIQITLHDRAAEISAADRHYFINQNKNYLLKDAQENILLQADKKNYSLGNETFQMVNCKGWYIALADASGNIIAKGNYTMFHDDARISIEMNFYNESIAAMMAYQLGKKSKKIAESNVALLALAGVF